MKINFKVAKQKDIYEVGDVFKHKNYLYLLINDTNEGYTVVCLSKNNLVGTYDTFDELVEDVTEDGDTLVNAEINVF